MASNTIIQCTASSSHVMKTYDVFVSFRGEDTRNNFTGFLFEALRRNGIEAFKDNEDLKKGESIAPELLQAIEGSRVFVVVFSKNYASSTWCLRELAQIFNCFESSSRHVLPIFYDVDPAEVRKQSGCYEKAFAQHEERFREDKEKIEEVHRWREYLKHVANLVGWDIRDKPQYAKIEEIAQNIKEKLGSKFSSLPKDNLVGMESRVEELASHLESDNDVRFVGISGMGGVGKTTLARALYEQISHQYDAHCFIDDVSQTYRKYPGALGVQKLLLSQSLKEKNIEICNISEGTQLVFSRLRNAKGLIVFDNVDQVEQLNIFSGSREFTMLRECLGGGSRVIIVSRDEHILKTHGVDDVYKVEPLNREDAIQLFCRKAFKCNYIISDYEELTHDILSHVQGHPLTIEVIGSSLFGKNISQWRSTLVKLRNNQSENIMDKLRIGFDELDGTSKEIFLDIACFFDYQPGFDDFVNWLLPSLSIFSCMVHLDLSFCNLVQVPNAIGNLHSLERLSLRGNNFAVMPSLKELSKLVHLNLQHCKLLENLPELPSRTDDSSRSLENYLETLSLSADEIAYGLNTFNCVELAKREGCSNMCFAWVMQIVKWQWQWQWPLLIQSIIPGSEIPRWFKSEDVCTDNIMRIDKSAVMNDNDWIGVACSAIFVARNQRGMVPLKYLDRGKDCETCN